MLLSNLERALFKGAIKYLVAFIQIEKKHQLHYLLFYNAIAYMEQINNVKSPRGGSKTLYMNVHTRTRSLHSRFSSDSYSLKQFMDILWLRHQRATMI